MIRTLRSWMIWQRLSFLVEFEDGEEFVSQLAILFRDFSYLSLGCLNSMVADLKGADDSRDIISGCSLVLSIALGRYRSQTGKPSQADYASEEETYMAASSGRSL